MLRRVFTLLSALSMLLCVAMCVLWVRVTRGTSDDRLGSVYLVPLAARYTFDFRDGRFVLSGPPPMKPASVEEGTVRTRWFPAGEPVHLWPPQAIPPTTKLPHELAATMRNEDLLWQVYLFDGALPRKRPNFALHGSPRGRPGTPTSELAPYGPYVDDAVICVDEADPAFPPWRLPPYTVAQTAKPLLAALEDENRWIAAHVALRFIVWSDEGASLIAPAVDWPAVRFDRDTNDLNRFVYDEGGLRADLHAQGPETPYRCCYRAPADGRTRDCQATIDPAQRTVLIDLWHRRLDVPVASASPLPLAAATFATPAAWAVVGMHRGTIRRRRRRAGRCPVCSYDLRASPERCPECGAAATSAARRV